MSLLDHHDATGEELSVDEAFSDFNGSDIRRTTTIVLSLIAICTMVGIALLTWWSRVQTENACSDLSVVDQMAPDRMMDGVERKLVDACRAMKLDR